MHAARTAGLGPATKPHLFQQPLHFEGDAAHIGPADSRNRIEIDPQFVRVVKFAGTHRVRMQFDAAQINDPGEPGRIVDNHFFRGPA